MQVLFAVDEEEVGETEEAVGAWTGAETGLEATSRRCKIDAGEDEMTLELPEEAEEDIHVGVDWLLL